MQFGISGKLRKLGFRLQLDLPSDLYVEELQSCIGVKFLVDKESDFQVLVFRFWPTGNLFAEPSIYWCGKKVRRFQKHEIGSGVSEPVS